MNPNRNRKRGKATEHKIAKLTNGMRLGILGNDDVRSGNFSYEIKNRVKFSGSKFMEQCIRNAPEGMTPIVRIHIHNSRYEDDLILLRNKDFENLVKEK